MLLFLYRRSLYFLPNQYGRTLQFMIFLVFYYNLYLKMERRPRVIIYVQMSATYGSGHRGLAGLTLDDVLGNQQRSASPTQNHRTTLLQHLRDEDRDKRDNNTWKAFKDTLRLKRAGSAWVDSIHIPDPDIPIPVQNNNPTRQYKRDPSNKMNSNDDVPISDPDLRSQMSQGSLSRRGSLSSRYDPDLHGDPTEARALRPQISRHNSTRTRARSESSLPERKVVFRDEEDVDSSDDDEGDEGRVREPKVRELSAREAVAAQEAAEAAAAAAEEKPAKTSLMDLLDGYDEEEYENEEEEEVGEEEGTIEYDCCVCMVRHTGAAYIPCGHSFCRLCSRELDVSRKYCPLCNGFICEILDIC